MISSVRIRVVFEMATITKGLVFVGIYLLCALPANAKEYRYKVCLLGEGRYSFDLNHCEPARVGIIVTASPKFGGGEAEQIPAKAKPKTALIPPTQPTSSSNGAAPKVSKACPNGLFSHLVIGDFFNDLNFIDTANCNAAAAKGAQFSWARDAIAGNNQWVAKGAVALESIWLNVPTTRPEGAYVNLFAVAPVVSFQRVENTNPKIGATQNVDVLSYGFSSTALVAGVQDALQNNWQIYLRARATANGDWEGHTNSWSTTFELEPMSDAYRIGSNILIGDVAYLWFYPGPVFSGSEPLYRSDFQPRQ